MSQPGHLDLQRALIKDYGRYAERFEDIARYLREHQPPALMLCGRHDTFFADNWIEDWRTMSQPGHLDLQRALVKDYGRYADRFGMGEAKAPGDTVRPFISSS